MSDFETQSRDDIAAALVDVCRDVGRQIEFFDGDNFVGIWCQRSEASTQSRDEISTDTEQETRSYFIPRQYDASGDLIFPPENGDGLSILYTFTKIRDAGRELTIDSFATEGNGAQYICQCTRIKPTVLGVPK